MKALLLSILLVSTTVLLGQEDSYEVIITPDEDWRIVSSNNDNGFAFFYNPSKIWRKGSLLTCYIKLTVDSVKIVEFQNSVGEKYNHSIYKLQFNCPQKNFLVVGIFHYDNKGDKIVLSQKKNNQFLLNRLVKESIMKNVCKETTYPWFDAKKVSPF